MNLKKILNDVLAFFRSNATTIGISPKLLGAAITGLLIQGANALHIIDPSGWLLGLLTFVGMSIAAAVFGPGQVAPLAPVATIIPSDSLLTAEAKREIDKAAKVV